MVGTVSMVSYARDMLCESFRSESHSEGVKPISVYLLRNSRATKAEKLLHKNKNE